MEREENQWHEDVGRRLKFANYLMTVMPSCSMIIIPIEEIDKETQMSDNFKMYIGIPGASKNGGLESENWRMEDEEDADLARQGLFVTDEKSTVQRVEKEPEELIHCELDCLVEKIAKRVTKRVVKKLKREMRKLTDKNIVEPIGKASHKEIDDAYRKYTEDIRADFAKLVPKNGARGGIVEDVTFARLATDAEIEQRNREALRKQAEELQMRRENHAIDTAKLQEKMRRLEEELHKSQVERVVRAVGSPLEPKIEPKKPGNPRMG